MDLVRGFILASERDAGIFASKKFTAARSGSFLMKIDNGCFVEKALAGLLIAF